MESRIFFFLWLNLSSFKPPPNLGLRNLSIFTLSNQKTRLFQAISLKKAVEFPKENPTPKSFVGLRLRRFFKNFVAW